MYSNFTDTCCWRPSRNPDNVEIIRVDDKTVELRNIDAFFVELLKQIPGETDPGDDKIAHGRLFSKPTDDPEDELNEEWETYVEPGLRHLFESATETVSKDLERFEKIVMEGVTEYSLSIPVDHLDQWLNTLNQARLSMAMRNRLTDEELAADFSPVINSKRDMQLLQIHIYGFLQEMFLRELD